MLALLERLRFYAAEEIRVGAGLAQGHEDVAQE